MARKNIVLNCSSPGVIRQMNGQEHLELDTNKWFNLPQVILMILCKACQCTEHY